MDNTQRQVASLGAEEPQKTDPFREVQVRELQGQLETLRAKMHRMQTLEKSFSETKRQLEVRDLSEAPFKEYTLYHQQLLPECRTDKRAFLLPLFQQKEPGTGARSTREL